MISRIQQKLLHHIDEHYLSYTRHWQDLYTQLHTLNRSKMQEIVITRLQRSGLSIKSLTNDRSLFYGELQVGAEQTFLLYMHLPDLSPAATASYITTTLISYQAALDTCFLVLGSLPVNIKLVFNGWLIQPQQDFGSVISDGTQCSGFLHADRYIWYSSEQNTFSADAFPLIALGTRGSINVELTAHDANVPIEAQYGAIAPNAAWQLLWALNTVKDRREDILIEGFYDSLLPVEDEIVDALAHLADKFPSLSTRWELQEPYLGLQGLQQYCAYFLTPTCTVSSIHSGQPVKNFEGFIPQTASAQLDFQLVPRQDPIDIYARLQNHLRNHNHTTLQTQLLRAIRPTYTPLSDPFVKFVIRATTIAYDQQPQILPLVRPDAPSHLLQKVVQPGVIIPLPFVVNEPQAFDTKDYQESLIKYIKQETIIMAGAIFMDETEQ